MSEDNNMQITDIKIYRVEDDEGEGMYYGKSHLTFDLDNEEIHPLPENDSSISKYYWTKIMMGNFKHTQKFGFVSLDQLKMWIHSHEIRKRLDEANLLINVYVPKGPIDSSMYVLGDTQAIFTHSLFTQVNSLQLTKI